MVTEPMVSWALRGSTSHKATPSGTFPFRLVLPLRVVGRYDLRLEMHHHPVLFGMIDQVREAHHDHEC